MSEARGLKTIKEEGIYNRWWSYSNTNCKKSPRLNLNKVLAIAADEINRDKRKKAALINREVDYVQKMWKGTKYELTPQDAIKKFDCLMSRQMRIQFQHLNDVKFRHSPSKFKWFYTFVRVIEETIKKYPQLDEFLNGPNLDFEFSDQYLEAKMEFMSYHEKQIIRTEQNENCEFDNLWTLMESLFSYALNHDNRRMPLSDAFRQ